MRYLLLSVLVFLVGILMVPNAFAQDRGDFYLTYEPTAIYPTFEDRLKDYKFLENHIENLNYIFQLPHDVEIIIADSSYDPGCEYPNAYYGDRKILICYELIADTEYRFEQYYERQSGYDWTTQEQLLALDDSVENVIENTLYHELGHALIDIYGLPTTGLEENVADQFAAYFALQFPYQDDPKNTIGQSVVLDTAWDYYLISEEYPDLTPSHFADTHSLNEQRFNHLACWTYGAYPNDSQWMLDEEFALADRAENWCEEEYQKIVQFWNCQPVFQEGVISASALSSCPASSGGFEWVMILIPVIIIVVVVVAIKSRKKTSRTAPQRKTFGVKQPKKRRTGSPASVPPSGESASTFAHYECPNCHSENVVQNPNGSELCSDCGWKS